MPHLPVYKVKPEQGQEGVRSLHRDNLLPIGQWVRMPESTVDVEPLKGVKTRSQLEKRHKRTQRQTESLPELSKSSSESEGERPDRHFRACIDHLLQNRVS